MVLEVRGPGPARPSLLRVPPGRRSRCQLLCTLTWGSEGNLLPNSHRLVVDVSSLRLCNWVPVSLLAAPSSALDDPQPTRGLLLDALPHPESNLPGGAQSL